MTPDRGPPLSAGALPMTASQTRGALREALDYLTPHPSTKGPVILDPAKMRAAVSALEAEVEGLSQRLRVSEDLGEAAYADLRAGLSDLTEARALAQRTGEERDQARDLNRDLHRRVQKAESFRARHGNIYGVKARWRDRQRRRKAEAERDEAVKDMEAAEAHAYGLDEKIASLSPHGTCACSYDRPGDVCMHHSPALVAAIAERDRAVAVIKGLMSDFLPSDPGDWYAPPGEASVAAATRFLADRELALRAARSVIEPTEGEAADDTR